MSNPIPSFLKLHEEPPHDSDQSESPILREFVELCNTFERVTGHLLTCRDDLGDADRETIGDEDDYHSRPPTLQLVVEPRPAADRTLANSHVDAAEHATAINNLVNELHQTRHALWQREAELAAGVPVIQNGSGTVHLADRLETVLRSGAEAVGCQAAALYMLNDETSELKLRAGWGLDHQKLLEPARPLRGAVADLEALIGHAVVLEDTSLLPNWRVPLEFASAVCVPVATPSTILGTLWIFGDETRDFNEDQTNLVEIVAGRIAADLEREMLLQQTTETKALDRNMHRACQWQQARLPTIEPDLDHWRVAGWTSTSDHLTGSFFDWSILASGQLSASLGQACGSQLEAALTAAALHSAIKSHAEYPHGVEKMLRRVNDTFWFSSTGGQFASLAYCLADTEKFDIEFATAGDVGVVLLREGSCEVRSQNAPWLGLNDNAEFAALKARLEPYDALIVYTDTIRRAIVHNEPAHADELISAALLDFHGESAAHLIEHLRSFVDAQGRARASVDRAILVVQRR